MLSYIFFPTIFFACTVSLWADNLSFSVEGAVTHALAHNPTLAAARLRIDEARGRLHQGGRLANPELEVELSRKTSGPEGAVGIALVQRFPLTSRLRHEKAVSQAELAAALAEVRDAERRHAAEVRTNAVKFLALGGQRALRSQQLVNNRQLSDFLNKRVTSGEASQVEALQVELESRQIEVEDLLLAAEEEVLLGDLRSLLGVAGTDRILITGELPAPQKSIPAGIKITGRPDILAAQSRAEAARSIVLEQRARRWEDVGFGVSYTRERTLDEPEPVETEQVVGIRFSLPLPVWQSNSGRIREAQAAALRADMEVDALQNTANAEVIAALGAMRTYAKLIGELDDKVLPAATRIEDQLGDSYSTGQTPLTDMLRARTRRLELQGQRLDALRDYHLARIRHTAASDPFNPSKTSRQ